LKLGRQKVLQAVTVVIVDKKFSLAVELKDDSKTNIEEAIGTSTYSTSKSTVLSYVSMFESFLKLTELYDESQSKLNDTTDELEAMKKYLNEVLEEIDKFRKTSGHLRCLIFQSTLIYLDKVQSRRSILLQKHLTPYYEYSKYFQFLVLCH
jgi:hypothetical protein